MMLADQALFMQKAFINGQWVNSVSEKTFDVHNPATGEKLGTCPECSPLDAEKAIQSASQAFITWRRRSGRDRSRILRKWHDLVIEAQDDLAKLITVENGKAKPDALGEVIFAASFLEWFSEEAARVYGEIIPHSKTNVRASVVKEPIGVCGMITPWNFPAGMLARKVAAALAAGCTCVVKTAGETPFTANALLVLAERAGVPKGVINIVTALENTPEIGRVLCASPIVKKISFTGSTRVGSILMRQCSGTLKKLSLELGGNAPFIIFDDADLQIAIDGLIASKFKCSGQTCVCANRVYVQSGIFDKFAEKLVETVKQFRVGNGMEEGVTHGPLIHGAAVDKVTAHVEDAVSKGAKILLGGSGIPKLGKNFYQPTILTNMKHNMAVVQEETFGPMAALFKFNTEAEVISQANNSDVGLAAYVFTKDLDRAYYMSEALEVGMVGINTGVISDASSPFGGVKLSGLGREGSKYGLEEYLQLKTVLVAGVGISSAPRAHL